MATWQGVNINTGAVELPKNNAEGVFEEVYVASLTTALANGDTIYGPTIQPGLFVTNVKVASDALDSAVSPLLQFEVGYINSGGTTVAGFIASGNTVAGAGGIASMNVAAGYGQSFTSTTTVQAVITQGAGTAVAGKFRLGVSLTASP
jgi:hypothetical protein